MRISELNPTKKTLTNIGIEFQGDSRELKILDVLLMNIGAKTSLEEQRLAFFDVFELEKLIGDWKFDSGKVELKKILNRQKIIWSGKRFSFDLTFEPIVYSIMNVTPDSFYDGNPKLTLKDILARVERDLMHGASVVELGGKSSKPNFDDISAQEEWLRLEEAIAEIRRLFPEAILAVDTNEPYVMRRVLDAGVDIINDIDGFQTAEKLEVIKEYKPSVVAMNNGRIPHKFSEKLSVELMSYFSKVKENLREQGLSDNQLVIDSGVGFFDGPSAISSVQRMKVTKMLTELGIPIMAAISRKSFLPNLFEVKEAEKLFGTLLFEAQMIQDGARVLRVHDSLATTRLIDGIVKYNRL